MRQQTKYLKKDLLKRDYLSPPEAAYMFDLHRRTINYWINSGKILAYVRYTDDGGMRYRIPISEVKRVRERIKYERKMGVAKKGRPVGT